MQTNYKKYNVFEVEGKHNAKIFIAGDEKVTDIGFDTEFYSADWVYDPSAFISEIKQIQDYFLEKNKNIDIDYEINATGFKQKVLKEIEKIPYGQTKSYKEIAILAGSPNAARAVGNVCRSNRILFAIPCHRVVASNGIGGYGENIHIKKWLLDIENSKY